MISQLLNYWRLGRLSVVVPISSLLRAIKYFFKKKKGSKMKEINKRTNAQIHRNFNNSCISCVHSKLASIELYPQTSFCNKWKENVLHFRESCHEFAPTKKLKPLTDIHVQYLLDLQESFKNTLRIKPLNFNKQRLFKDD